MTANAVVDDAIAHPDHKSADEGGIVDGLEADGMLQADGEHPLDPPFAGAAQRNRGPDHDAEHARCRLDQRAVFGDHLGEEPEAPVSHQQPDQIAGGRRHPLEEPIQDRAALLQGHPRVGHDRPDPDIAEDVASPLQLDADGIDADPLASDLVAGLRVAPDEGGGNQRISGGDVISAGSPETGGSAR